MKAINIITIICLILMIVGVTTVVFNLITKKRDERITYIRTFKKGKGVLIYLYAIPLFWVGITYSGTSVLDGFFNAIRRIVDLIVLKYDFSPVQSLMEANDLYSFTIYFCFVLVGLNAILFALSLASQYVWAFFKRLSFKISNKERLILFGNNEYNYSIYKSEARRSKLIVDKIADKDALSLYMKDISYANIILINKYIANIVHDCVSKYKNIYAVINTGNDEKNIELSRCFINSINELDGKKREKCFSLLRVFVFGDPRYEAIYEDIISDSCGCVSYINKYQKMAIDFIDKYPFTKFMNEEQIDYNTSYIKEGVEINALMIGFGKTNRQMFLTSVANNQFIKEGKDGAELKKVNYHIFDRKHAENNKNFNHSYNRYKNECSNIKEEEYLPLPDYPAEEFYHLLDINDINFYSEIRKILTNSTNDVNFIIIAFGSDLANIDLAQKLVSKVKEWEVKNITIFVKVRGDHKGQNLLEEENCYIIGNENDAVYNIDNIIGDKIFNMAQLRNEVYDLEYEITNNSYKELSDEKIQEIKETAQRNWFAKKSQLERESSLYCCLSLRMKLNLMGLDYCDTDSENFDGLSEEEYLKIYAKEDLPDNKHYSAKANDKSIIKYNLNFSESRRKSMAVHEHLRWNSFMISKGIVPATKEQILNETVTVSGITKHTNGKRYDIRRHGNLTTFTGLVEFRKMIASRDNVSEESKDVIKYDYQLLDDAYWLLKKTNHKIIRKIK